MLKDKVALVTGGSRGIGKAIALKLASLGANIVINYEKNQESADNVIKEVESFGVKGLALQCNVADYKSCEDMVKNIAEEFGAVDILVNNAGITRDKLILRMNDEDFSAVLDVNLKGAFNCSKHVASLMLKKKIKGKIVNISSVVGLIGNVGQANYAAAKAGLIGMTKSMAKELGGKEICINAVAPGFIETDMTKVLSEAVIEKMESAIPMKKFGKPEDVAEIVAFLSTPSSNYITGQVINCDGGMVM
ncbi:3-oxoacyl-[acyl-carrier-protein] reductase [Clostridium cylindrosporum]|uniref:3-oxoacyl-[acyl-carrier-protein] reductase n=1 Tax=Clostridium cylindrosporum TaxID=1495 RepID=UPI00065CA4FD|nr:3-oxoacyl-[acyl-carrier-protein] reductase [Clostridium cylindrosporum]